MVVSVRAFEPSDVEDILRIYQSFGVWFEDIGVNRDFIISSTERPDFRLLVAQDGGGVIGFVGCLYYTSVRRGELGPIGVDLSRQGEGVGSILMDAIMGFLNEAKISKVIVKVKASNQNAINFFLSRGLFFEAYLRGYTKKGEDIVQMSNVT